MNTTDTTAGSEGCGEAWTGRAGDSEPTCKERAEGAAGAQTQRGDEAGLFQVSVVDVARQAEVTQLPDFIPRAMGGLQEGAGQLMLAG